MGEQKQWLDSQGIVLYSDLTGADKYIIDLQPYNFFKESLGAQASQYSFRFVNNDGDEDASTFKAALNTNVTLSPNDVARIRFLIDSLGSLGPKNFIIECRHKPSGGSFGPWEPIA